MLLQIPLTLSKRLSYFGMYTAKTRLLTKFKSAFLNLLIVTKKTGKSIAELINETLRKNGIHVPLADCRGQGYDNGSNMSGSYKGAQARIIQKNPLAKFCPGCACHSLNLCGVSAAECCPEVITFFGIIQRLYTLFSCSPQR